MAVFAYCRVSTKEQSTDQQVTEIEKAGFVADAKHTFAENISGAVLAADRPMFQKLFHKLRDGDTLVVTKLDRLGRNAIDVEKTVTLLAAEGVRVIVLQLGAVDLTSPVGKLQMQMMSAFAEFERSLIAERTGKGRDEAMALLAAGKPTRKGKTSMGRAPTFSKATRDAIRARFEETRNVSAVAAEFETNRAMVQRICADLRAAVDVAAS